MTTDPFTDAARAETPEPCEHHWVSHGQDSALIPWAIRCGLCGAFDIAEMERLARAHLAAQEPTDAEAEAAARAIHINTIREFDDLGGLDQHALRTRARKALSAARAARRDEEKR